ncbi:MAG: hypothetical protein SH850_18040 [Planctomycetaceae bacterium]|nr:hypothetical protein [Planctomycetaceae bacterium]
MPADDSEPSSPTEPQPPRLRGLWGVMASEAGQEIVADSDTESPAEEVKPRGLWGVMGAASEVVKENNEPVAEVVSTEAIADLPTETPAEPFAVATGNHRISGDQWALITGLAAVPAAAAAYWPGLVAALPGAVLGFIAVWFAALHGFSSTQPAATRWRALIGGGLGCLALVLGPFVFTPWGNAARDRGAVPETQQQPQPLHASDANP